jgi:hypothetical protein
MQSIGDRFRALKGSRFTHGPPLLVDQCVVFMQPPEAALLNKSSILAAPQIAGKFGYEFGHTAVPIKSLFNNPVPLGGTS